MKCLLPVFVLLSLSCNGFCSESQPTTLIASPAETATDPSTDTTVGVIGEEGAANATDQVDFDFVNLPGYGVIDDVNSTANASQFSCYHRRYGYYADVAKNCLMFHLCYPVQEPTTQEILFQRFSFVCSDNAIFDQQHLVCVDNETLTVTCEDAPSYFDSSNDKLIASLHQSAQGYVYAQPKAEDGGEAAEEIATESTISETILPPAEVHQQPNATTTDEEAQQYGALLESLFG